MAVPFTYGFTNVAGVIGATAQGQINTAFAKALTYIPDPAAGKSAQSPDFDEIAPNTAILLRNMITALKAAINAAPAS